MTATRPPRISPARTVAFTVLRRVFEQDAYADRAFAAEARGLDARDRALAMAMAYGAVQRRGTLDHIAARLLSRPPGRLDPPVIAALRLGLFQILYLDGVADHAAVHESVELVKRSRPAASGLVNAVLRRATTEGREILAGLHDRDPDAAALLHSVPAWLARRWWDELGEQDARSLLAAINQPAESALRVNTLVAGVDEVARSLSVPFTAAPGIPEGLVLEGAFDAEGSAAWNRGAIMPQSRASMLVSRVLAPAAGERVLDLCAAPGAKTTQIAALMADEGEVVAIERHPGRAEALRRTCERMHASAVRVLTADAAGFTDAAGFDRVLVDPPCSGLGTLQSRPDLRWRATPDSIDELVRDPAQDPGRGRERHAPWGHAGLLGVHDLAGGGGAAGATIPAGALRVRGPRPARAAVATGPGGRPRRPAAAPRPRPNRWILHLPARTPPGAPLPLGGP